MRLNDKVTLSDFALTAEGYLMARAKLSRTGIQEYYGFEIDGPDSDALYKIYRPADEVFDPSAMASFMGKPVTDAHPWEGVTASNWRQEAVGFVKDDVRRQDDHMVATLMINDAEIANRIQRAGSVELSCGYDSELVWEQGVTPEGGHYDAYQRNLRGNHVAVVERGRCGASCAVYADSQNVDRSPGSPKIVMLHASADTQRALRGWAVAHGFDISRSHGGDVQHVEDFGFHVTVVATNNPVTLPTGEHDIAPTPVRAVGFDKLGADKDVPALALPTDGALGDMRRHFVNTYGSVPTYPEFKPHLSLSYAWSGLPALDALAVPDFDLVFDRIVVSDMKPKPAPVTQRTDGVTTSNDCAGRGRCACTRKPDEPKEHKDMSTKQVKIGDKTFDVAPEVADAMAAAEAAVETKTPTTADAAAVETAAKALDAAATAIDVKDGALAAKDAEIAELKAQIPTADALDKMASDRASLIGDAKAIAADVVTDGLSDADIRKAAVAAKLGDKAEERLAGRSDTYVEATFDAMLATARDAPSDGIADAISAAGVASANNDALNDRDAARAANMQRNADAWKGAA